MKVVIIGNGGVGELLVEYICREGHNVTVIDEDASTVDAVVNKYDVMGIIGNGSSVYTQKEAGMESADLVIAVSPSDEVNIICCMIARRLGAKHSIARVRDPEYLNQNTFMCRELGIDMIVNPEYEAARDGAKLVRFPAAMKLDKFAQGRVEVAEIFIGENHPLANIALKDFKAKFSTNALICAVRRGDEALIPAGDFVIKSGDYVSLTASRADITDLFVKIGAINKNNKIKNVMILGGGRMTKYLAQALCDDYKIKIIEEDLDICDELSKDYPKCDIIHGDPADPDVLVEEGIDSIDVCIPITHDDSENIIMSLFAKTRNVDKVISYISASYVKLAETSGVDTHITPKITVVAKVLGYVRGLANAKERGSKSGIKALYNIANNSVEALEFDVAEDFEGLSIPLRDIKLKRNLLIAAIIRGGQVIYPNGQSTIEIGDSVIVVAASNRLSNLNNILA